MNTLSLVFLAIINIVVLSIEFTKLYFFGIRLLNCRQGLYLTTLSQIVILYVSKSRFFNSRGHLCGISICYISSFWVFNVTDICIKYM